MSKYRFLLLMPIFALAGCDRISDLAKSYDPHVDKIVRSTGYVCNVDKFIENEQMMGQKKAKKLREKNAGVDGYSRTLTFLLYEYEGALFSKNRKWLQTYFTLEQVETSFGVTTTYNKWPNSKYGFTHVVAIRNGYDARIEKDGKILRRNIEAVNVEEGRVVGKIYDTYYDKETFEAARPSLKDKNVKLPYREYSAFTLNTISGDFYKNYWVVTDYDEMSKDGNFKGSHYYGT